MSFLENSKTLTNVANAHSVSNYVYIKTLWIFRITCAGLESTQKNASAYALPGVGKTQSFDTFNKHTGKGETEHLKDGFYN
jgi:hypothetical protein